LIYHIVRANSILLIQYAVGSLIPLMLVPHIVSEIGLTEYGKIAVCMAWGGYGAMIVQYSFHLTGPKRLMQLKTDETTATVFNDVVGAKIILLIFTLIASMFLCFSNPIELENKYVMIILVAMPVAAAFNSTWMLQSQDKFLHICAISIAGTVLTLSIGFSYINRNHDHPVLFSVMASISSMLFNGISSFIVAAFVLKNKLYIIPMKRITETMRDGIYLFASQFISMGYSASGPILINHLMNSESAGAYSVIERVIAAITSAALLTHTAAYPRLALTYVSEREAYWSIIKKILMLYLSVTFLLALVIWHKRDYVLVFLYGRDIGDGSLLLLFGLCQFMSGIFGVVLTGYLVVSGQSSAIWSINVKVLVVTISLGVIGIKFLGVYGWMVGALAAQLINVYYGIKYWFRDTNSNAFK